VVPRLSRAGIEFAQGGYRDSIDRLAGGPRDLPVSVVGGAGVGFSRPESEHAALHRSPNSLTGHELELLSAGTLMHRLTYQLDVGTTRQFEDAGVGVAFVQLADVVRNGALNLKLGRFDSELPFLSQTRRTTFQDYLMPVTLEAQGMELNGGRSGWTYAAALVTSQRHTQGPNHPAQVHDRLEDTCFRVMREVMGHPLGAQMLFDRQDSELPTHTWLQHLRLECATSLGTPRVTIIPAYLFDRFDDRPAAGIHERHQYFLLEAVTTLDGRGRWPLTARYEHDYRSLNAVDPEDHRQLEALDLARFVTPNAKLGVESSRSDERLGRQHRDELGMFLQVSY